MGGWILSGVDSGKYSRLLMQMAEFFAESKKLDLHPKQATTGSCTIHVPPPSPCPSLTCMHTQIWQDACRLLCISSQKDAQLAPFRLASFAFLTSHRHGLRQLVLRQRCTGAIA